MLHSADCLNVFLAIAPVFQVLLSLLALPGQTGGVGTADNVSLLSVPDMYNTLSEYSTPKRNRITGTIGVFEKKRDRVSTTGSQKNSMAVDNADRTVNSDSIRTSTDTSDNSTDTGNDPDVSVPEQTTGNTMNVGNIASESVYEQIAHHIMYTDLNVTSENVRATVPTSGSSLITTSPVTPAQYCEAMVCEKDAGYFVINTTACSASDSPTIDTSISTTLEILGNINSVSPDILCYWNIRVPIKNYIIVTIDQLVLEDAEHNSTRTLELFVENAVNIKRVFNVSALRNGSVTFTSSSSLFFRFRGHDLHLASGITFHFRLRYGSVVEDLPVVRLTDTVSYVTSPWFNGLNRFYPGDYEGKFHLHLSDDQSAFISFTHFVLEKVWTARHTIAGVPLLNITLLPL